MDGYFNPTTVKDREKIELLPSCEDKLRINGHAHTHKPGVIELLNKRLWRVYHVNP